MERQYAVDLIRVISKSSDKNAIYKALVKLRWNLVKDKEGVQRFYELDGIPALVRLISKPYEKILDLSLSILGNCCTDKECCKQAISFGVVPPILTILKSIPNPTVQCRACRLIGNLARESNERICTLAKGIGIAIAAVLDDNQDVQTINMAIRATRLLWNEMPFFEEFIRSDGIKKIIRILVTHTKIEEKNDVKSVVEINVEDLERVTFMEEHIQFMESVNSKVFDREILKKTKPVEDTFKIPDTKPVNELLAEILRCLQTVTNTQSLRVIYDFYVDEHGCNCIVFFARPDSPFRAQALKILSNLSRSQNSIEFLSSADAITVACNLITCQDLETPLTESEERHCVGIICFLAGDACNRAKIRMSGAFKRIMEIAKHTKCDVVLSMILVGLKSFKYDNISIDLMIKIGLVTVLVERLDMNTKDLTENHTRRMTKRTAAGKVTSENIIDLTAAADDTNDAFETIEQRPKRMKIEYSPASYPKDYFSPAGSPSGSNYNYSFPSSPCSSSSPSPRSLSPKYNKEKQDENLDSEYSPVCSDIEDTNEEDGTAVNEFKCNVVNLSDDKGEQIADAEDVVVEDSDQEDEDIVEEKDKTLSTSNENLPEKLRTVQLILEILCSVSYRIKNASDLCTPSTLDTLLTACRVAFKRKTQLSRWDDQGAPLVLSHIASEVGNFSQIIKQNFIFKLYDMTQPHNDHQDCSTCTDLSDVGTGLLETLKGLGETGYGYGEVAHLLLKGEKQIHKHVAVVTTYIFSNPKQLHRLLVECGALYTVMEIILTKDDSLCNAAASGLTSLSIQLQIAVPKYDEKKIDENLLFDRSLDTAAQNSDDLIVTFIVGDRNDTTTDNRIEFDYELLIGCSDVFSSMLKSDFKESKDREIHLKNQTVDGVKYFLNSIRQRADAKPLLVANSETIGAVLETYDMCQIYMLPELEADIWNMILFMLNEKTALKIFEFSMTHHKQDLSEIAINYYLCANVAGDVKVAMYREADNSEHFKEWNQMMLDTIVYTCQHLI